MQLITKIEFTHVEFIIVLKKNSKKSQKIFNMRKKHIKNQKIALKKLVFFT